MVLKQERRVNAASVAKRQSISAAAAQKKLEVEEAAREVALQKAWSVGADQALFLFCCDAAKQAWERNADKNRADAEGAWPALVESTAAPSPGACCAQCGCCKKRASAAAGT